MVSNYGVVADGVVVNVVLSDRAFALEQGWVLLPEGVGPNWLYDGSTFSAPPPYVLSRKEQEEARAAAYSKEADPLFFKAQRGEATTEEWLALVAEIKVRFPYPSE